MVRERCSCGAEFESDEDSMIRLLREWRRKHLHQVTDVGVIVTDSARTDVFFQDDKPRLTVGFSGDGFDE